MKRVPLEERRRRAVDALSMVRLEGMERRKPGQLSGGQQQRVALARALANRPSVLLLDEPLGALDLKLRRAMQSELRTLNHEVGITFIYVTHDQEEALAMSDRIAVMAQGRIQQVGSSQEIYERPATRFVADFIGETNLLAGRVARVADGVAELVLAAGGAGHGRVGTDGAVPGVEGAVPGVEGAVTLAVRPERIAITPLEQENGHETGLAGTLAEAVYLGSSIQYAVELPGATRVTVRRPVTAGKGSLAPGTSVSLTWAPDDAAVLTA